MPRVNKLTYCYCIPA